MLSIKKLICECSLGFSMTIWSYEMKYCPRCKNKLSIKFLDGRDRLVCEQCGFVFWNNPIPVVVAIVPYDNGIVLVRSSIRKTWGLPAGHVEFGDSAEERVLMEVKEETNLDAEIDQFLGTWSGSHRSNVLFLAYSVRVLGGDLRPGGDAEDVGVFPYREALEIMRGRVGEKIILSWLRNRNMV